MRLETKRLILRTPQIKDIKDVVEGAGNLNVSKWLVSVPYPYKKKDAEIFIKWNIKISKKKKPENYHFMIELKSEKKVIGTVGIYRINYFNGVGTTGSWINKKYWKNGYITEAKIAVNDFAFNKLKLRRLNTEVFVNNKASNATQLKMGYKLEGMRMRIVRSKATGKIHDEYVYGLLKEDWQKARKRLIKKYGKVEN